MGRPGLIYIGVPGLALTLGLALASGAAAQGSSTVAVHDARRLGGTTAFYSPPLKTAASLERMAARKGMADDIRTVLRASGIPETGDGVLAALTGAASSVKGGLCDEATPADGTLVACEVQPGSTLVWMAYRPNVRRGDRSPGLLENVRWAGNEPFKALLFRVTNDYRIYTFVLPMACANLSLMSVKEIEGEPITVSVDRACDPKTGLLRATVKAAGKDLDRVRRVRVGIDGQPAGVMTAPSWTLTFDKGGNYAFDAVDAKDRSYPVGPRGIRLEACPPLEAPKAPQVVAPTCGVALSSAPVKGGYEITVDAARSTTGTSGVAPAVTIELRDAAGAGQKLTLDSGLTGKFIVRRPGTYRATALVSTPQAVEVGAFRYEGSATCESEVTIEKPAGGMAVFLDALGGKDRRVRPTEDTDLEFAQCSPLLGLKFGVAKRFPNNWEVAGAVGAAINLVNSDEKVNESAFFVDGEVNRYLSGGSFIGTGLSLWDLTHGDTMTPAWLLHAGLPLAKNWRYPLFFLAEGRLYLDHIDDVGSNYLIWAGLRLTFPR